MYAGKLSYVAESGPSSAKSYFWAELCTLRDLPVGILFGISGDAHTYLALYQ